MSQILLVNTTLHAATATKSGATGNMIIGKEPGYATITSDKGLLVGAFAFGLERGCGHAGYTKMFHNCAAAGWRRAYGRAAMDCVCDCS